LAAQFFIINLQFMPFSSFEVASEPCDVALRRSAELLFVIAAKIRWIFVTDADSGARGVQIFAEHQTPRFLKPDLFLKLQRTHRRDQFEVMVKAGNAHPEFVRNIFDFKRLVKVFAGHLNIGLNVGLSETQLNQIFSIIETNVGEKEADSGREVLNKVLKRTTNPVNTENIKETQIFPKGDKAPPQNFTGTVWVKILIPKSAYIKYSIGNVTFEPNGKSNWHAHPAGQILLVTDGKGFYQERGKPIKPLNKGDVVVCDANIEHWHGASPDNQMSHVTVTNYKGDLGVVWLKPVTDEEYTSGLK
jgi:quercetin dioxygenase-like cupin family protein